MAMMGVGWAAWLVTRRVTAVCVSVAILAASPFSIAYAAQARGYSEAMALTPLLLVSWEYLRRSPDSWFRASMAMLVTAMAALTVYTMWVFLVFPGLLLAVWLMPRGIECATRGRAVRTVSVLMLVSMVAFMTVYSAVRYKALFFASDYGERFGGLSEALHWVASVSTSFFAWPAVCLLLALAGAYGLWRSELRWWCAIIAAGVAMPLALALANGSPGYMRNLCHLLPLVALLGGVGAGMLVAAAGRRFGPSAVTVAAAAVLMVASTASYGAVQRHATKILYPDWGALVLELERTPERVGQRWLCPCLANHWQIDWYARRKRPEALLQVPTGGTIEVVMGVQLERAGAVVFRNDPYRGGIRPEPLPPYLAHVPYDEVRDGIELRRWIATKVDAGESSRFPSREAAVPAPVFLAISMNRKPSASQWREFLTEGAAYEAGVVAFNLDIVDDGFIQTMIVPSTRTLQVIDALGRYAGIDRDAIRVFRLDPFRS